MLYSRMDTALPPHPAFPPELQWREGTNADFALLAAFLTTAHPDKPVAEADLARLHHARLPEEAFAQTLVFRGETAVGLAEVFYPRMDSHPGWIGLNVHTLPQESGGPLPEALVNLAETQARLFGARTLVARVHLDWWEKAFLEAHGYAEHDRMWFSTLDLTTLDFSRFRVYEERAKAAGIRIQPLSKLGEFNDAGQRRLYELIVALLLDVPSTTQVTPGPSRSGSTVTPHS